MLTKIKKTIRKFIPEPILLGYHLALAKMAASFYGNPSQKLYVIGITGTKGKTSTANFVWSVLTAAGFQVGQIGTAVWRVGDAQKLNDMHMTMPGPFVLQKLLRQMVDANCTHVVMEVTSEGIKLSRHVGIIFDCAIFTNLSPEHLESHGSFENYKKTKGELFASLMTHVKQLNKKYVKRISIINNNDSSKDFYLKFPSDIKFTYGQDDKSDLVATKIETSTSGVNFLANGEQMNLSVPGKFHVYNALPAIALGTLLEIPFEKIKLGLKNLQVIEGRMQKIDEGQNFTVIVDYAHENLSLNTILDEARNLAGNNKVIILTGGQGGGRDRAKRAQMGRIAAKKADFVVVTNEDPYDDDPQEIIHEIADAAVAAGKIIGQNLFRNPDRRGGIAKALSLAAANDVVVIAGKGAEQTMMVEGGSIPWDDRQTVKEELSKLLHK
jgi:UDP-N-acetylmuramoyl-L-alanyl-D-glutamate--2,6-diaminopimelate ligase